MMPEITSEELAVGLDRMVEDILAKTRIVAPPVDAFAVARELGIAIAMDNRQPGRARYVRLSDRRSPHSRATILLSPEPRLERQQWAIAHEIGEHLACHVFAQWGGDPCEAGPNAREAVANHLAGRLLLPTTWFADEGATNHWDLIVLKSRFRTASHELIARRMLECRPSVIISIFDQRRVFFRRSNLPGGVPPLSSAEMQCWRNVHDRNDPFRSDEGSDSVQGWPIHEAGWKREILRRELDEYAVEVSDQVESWA